MQKGNQHHPTFKILHVAPDPHKWGKDGAGSVFHICNIPALTKEAEPGELQVQGQPWLHKTKQKSQEGRNTEITGAF